MISELFVGVLSLLSFATPTHQSTDLKAIGSPENPLNQGVSGYPIQISPSTKCYFSEGEVTSDVTKPDKRAVVNQLIRNALEENDTEKFSKIKNELKENGIVYKERIITQKETKGHIRELWRKFEKGKIEPISAICFPMNQEDKGSSSAEHSRKKKSIRFGHYSSSDQYHEQYPYYEESTISRQKTTQKPTKKPVKRPAEVKELNRQDRTNGCTVRSNIVKLDQLFPTVIAPGKIDIGMVDGPCRIYELTEGHSMLHLLNGGKVGCIPTEYSNMDILYYSKDRNGNEKIVHETLEGMIATKGVCKPIKK